MLSSNVNALSLADFSSPSRLLLGSVMIFRSTRLLVRQLRQWSTSRWQPGKRLGRHTDSSEEVIYIVEGEGEVTVGDERAAVSTGTLAVAPALVPHDVRNTGSSPLKVVGFFAGSALMHTFFEPMLPERR